jgi:hypothetical protein
MAWRGWDDGRKKEKINEKKERGMIIMDGWMHARN